MFVNIKPLFFVALLICLAACSSEKNNGAEAISNTEVERTSDKRAEVKIEQKSETVSFKSNETLAKEKLEKTVDAKKNETTAIETNTKKTTTPLLKGDKFDSNIILKGEAETTQKNQPKEKEEIVFRIDPTDPLPLQHTSHKVADDHRDKEWNPRGGKYYFSEMWEFNYKNETLNPGEFGYEGEFRLYVDTKSGTILVDNSQRNMISDEMTDFVIVHSDGRCFEGFTDVHGEKGLKELGFGHIRNALSQAKTIEATFNKSLRPIGQEKKYGNTKNLMLRGRGYEMSYLKTNDKSIVHLARLPMSALPLYIFNEARTDGKLPIAFNFSEMVPSNFWILEEHNEVKGKVISFKLESITASTHFININDYR